MAGGVFCRHHEGMKKLLVVDDSELIRSRLVSMLKPLPGVREVSTAGSLQQALYTVSHFLPTLVILDLNLPDGNAVKIIPMLRRMVPDMRILVLTNDASAYNREHSLEAGADWFYDKSTEFEQALELLKQQSERNSLSK